MKRTILFITLLAFFGHLKADKIEHVSSPDGNLTVTVRSAASGVTYDIDYGGKPVLTGNKLGLKVNGKELPGQQVKARVSHQHQTFTPVVPLKFSHIEKDYNELTQTMQGKYDIVWRVYNEGLAYRFVTRLKGDVTIDDETISLNVPDDYMLHIQEETKFTSAYENGYVHLKSEDWTSGTMSNVPMLIDAPDCHLLFCEADLYDYPRAFMAHSDEGVAARFDKVWRDEKVVSDLRSVAGTQEDYIARTTGTRSFPWRYFVVGDDAQLITNTMCANLSSGHCELDDTSWIKPGKSCWEWWNGKNIYGPDVNFKVGFNTETYKYYVDFAAKYDIDYIIVDELWTPHEKPFEVNPGLDIHELINYANQKKVGVLLWVSWRSVRDNPDIFRVYSEWGAKGMKIDFMERSDQWISGFYENTAREAAKYHLVVDFHGAFTPDGLEYRFPNILAYEGVRGMEQMARCTPDNSLYLPFMRNAVGPMDYTPGAMMSAQPEYYFCGKANRPNTMSIGTRAYQLAMFVTCETGTQMLADSPTNYYHNPECTEFIAGVPVTWDETQVLAAKLGEYVVIAKRHGDKWYIGAETNHNEREISVSLDFLLRGEVYKMTSFSDGPNAGYQAMDYRKKQTEIDASQTINISMARNGGFAAVLIPLP